jgi:hypothetical protein
MLGGLAVFLILFLINSIYNSKRNKDKRLIKYALKNPNSFVQEYMEMYRNELKKLSISEEKKNSMLKEFEQLLNSWVISLKNGNRETLDECFEHHFKQNG